MSSTTSRPIAADAELLLDFINTKVYEQNQIGTVEELKTWLEVRNLVADTSGLSERDLRDVLAVREGVRQTMLANNGQQADGAAIDALNRVSARLSFRLAFSAEASLLLNDIQSSVVDPLLCTILATVHELMLNGDWRFYKACRNEKCQWAFVDRSKNHSRTWCEMSVCGNQAKARTFSQRRRSEATH